MTPLEILIAARSLIEKPENWNQGDYRNGDVYDCEGAIGTVAGWHAGFKSMWIANNHDTSSYYKARDYVVKAQLETMNHLINVPVGEVVDHVIASWDGVTHEDVLALFDKAIETLKSNGDSK